MDHWFSQELGEGAEEDADEYLMRSFAGQAWSAVPAHKTGYIESIDADALLHLARKYQTIVRMEHGIGEFVVEGTPLISVAKWGNLDDATANELNGVYVIGRQRVVEQDAAFGIRQLVDIAMKALSPGVNDTTTAVICVDYLTAILARLATRRITTSHWMDDQGELRVMARGPSFESLLSEAFDQIRQNANGNVAILSRMLGALPTIAGLTTSPSRRWLLRQKVEEIAEAAERTIESPHDRVRFERRLAWVREALETGLVSATHEKLTTT